MLRTRSRPVSTSKPNTDGTRNDVKKLIGSIEKWVTINSVLNLGPGALRHVVNDTFQPNRCRTKK